MVNIIKLWVLLIGINDYLISLLFGCVLDVLVFQFYFESNFCFDIDGSLKVLFDKVVIKVVIVDGIFNYLSQVGLDDVVLFYFFGYGVQEKVDVFIWIEEWDGCLEFIVCYVFFGVFLFLMVDKELCYLFNQVFYWFGVDLFYLLIIFDCCYFGDNVCLFGLDVEDVWEWCFMYVFLQWEWGDFFFVNVFQLEQLFGFGLGVLLFSLFMI